VSVISWLWLLIGVIGIIDAFRHPASDWAAADRNRAFWVAFMLFLGPIGAITYLMAVRPRFALSRGISDEFRAD
jgi:hypothetical protein